MKTVLELRILDLVGRVLAWDDFRRRSRAFRDEME
jgi:hypothetical protein